MKLVGLFVVLGFLFLLGCTTPGPQTPPAATAVPNQVATATPVTNDNGQGSNQPNQELQATPTPSGSSGNGQPAPNFEGLLNSFTPQECNVDVVEDGVPSHSIVRFLNGNFQMESTSTVEGKAVRGEVIYTSVPRTVYLKTDPIEGAPASDCVWYKYSANGTDENESAFDQTSLEDPGVSWNCKPALFSPSIFTPVGKVCDVNEMVRQAMDTVGVNPASYCDSLTDAQEKADCLNAMAGA